MAEEIEPREDLRIVRTSELREIAYTLRGCVDALSCVHKTESVRALLSEINGVQNLVASISLDDQRKPPAEIAGTLETQTRIL